MAVQKIEFDYREIVRNSHKNMITWSIIYFRLFVCLFVCLKVLQFFYLNASHLVGKAGINKEVTVFYIPLVKKEREKRKTMKNLVKNSKFRERLEKNFDVFYEWFLYFY